MQSNFHDNESLDFPKQCIINIVDLNISKSHNLSFTLTNINKIIVRIDVGISFYPKPALTPLNVSSSIVSELYNFIYKCGP